MTRPAQFLKIVQKGSPDKLTHAVIHSKSFDLGVIEGHFLSLDEVTNASVWLDAGVLRAHVSILKGSRWTENLLKSNCYEQLGLMQTPHSILLITHEANNSQLSLAG